MSETPETDSFTHSTDETPLDVWVYAGHAMRLERERDEARNFSKELMEKYLLASGKLQRERDEARMALKHIEEYGTKEINEAVTLRQELAKALLERDEAREENKKFREALEWISKRYDDSKPIHQVAMDAYDMSCTAGSVLQKEAK